MGLLIANDLCNLKHDETQLDSQLVHAALLWLNERVNEGMKADVRVVRDVCVEAVREVQRRRAEVIAMAHGDDLWSRTVSKMGRG